MLLKIAVNGNDRRFAWLTGLLKNDGHELTDCIEDAGLVVTKWPADIAIAGRTVISCGPGYAPEGIYDLLKDEEYQQQIAWMTAEGAIAAAMGKTGCAIRGAKCLVVGWGRIGRALTQLLTALGGDVTVLSRREDAFPEIFACGAKAGSTAEAGAFIQNMRFVFSTPPSMVIDAEVLENARRDAVIIDLASPPYGVDIEAAKKMGLRAWREPGLPGRYCPQNAAQAIYDRMRARGIFDA